MSLIPQASATSNSRSKEITAGDGSKDFVTLFSQKVVFPSLEILTLSSINVERIWLNHLPAMSSLKTLRKLTVEGCRGLKFLFSSSMVENLEKLQDLVIRNCESIEGIIYTEGLGGEGMIIKKIFPKLDNLELVDLPKLPRFCSGNLIELSLLSCLRINSCPKMETFISNSIHADLPASKEPEKILSRENFIQPLFDEKVGLPSLKDLILSNMVNVKKIWHDKLPLDSFAKLQLLWVLQCKKLSSILPFSMLGRLQKLEEFGVVYCDSVEEIVDKEEVVDAVPCFAFPNLTELYLRSLPKLKTFYPEIHISEWPVLKRLLVYDCDEVKMFASEFVSFKETRGVSQNEIPIQLPLFLLDKVTFPSLEQLGLGCQGILKGKWHENFSAFCKSKVLKLKHFNETAVSFSSCFLHILPNTEKLVISDAIFKEIFLCDGFACEETHAERLCELRELKLSYLPELLYLCKDTQFSKVFQNLATLVVDECGKLENLVPSTVSFQNLTSLEVSKCHGLLNLMTLSTAESLVKLTKLNITDCKMIEELIKHKGDEDNKDQIVFSKLKYLGLHCLPSFTCFCLRNFTVELPSLEQVIVRNCPNMKIFSPGVLVTPKLHCLQLAEEGDVCWEGDLNSTIRHLHKEMVGFREMEYLELSQFPHLKEIWHGQALPVKFFNNLSSLVVDNCTFISSGIPANLLRFLNNLNSLEVRYCDSLEQVFHLEELDIDEHFGSLFPKLVTLKLINLPKLKRFCNFTGNIIELPSLSRLMIENCPNLESFISNSTHEYMTAEKEPQEVTSEENFLANIQPLFDEKVAFPNLGWMTLSNLDSLQKIWHSQFHADSFCKLKVLEVVYCGKILTIVPYYILGRSSSIEELVIDNCASVQQVFNLEGLNEVERTAVAPFRLKQLFLRRLPKLKYIWNEDSQRHLTFQNLEKLSAIECWSMKSLFPMRMATSLMQLKSLKISSCGLEVIVAVDEVDGDGAPVFVFPQLTFLHLESLPELECFYPRLHTTEWPMLKCLLLAHCHKIKTFSSKLLGIQETDGDIQPKIPIQVPLFLVEKVVPNLERVSLNSNDITSIRLGHFPAEIFYRLKKIDLVCFHDKSAVFPSGFLGRFLNMEQLILYDCNFKRLFTSEVLDDENHDSRLDLLLQNLETLEIINCPSLTYLVPSTASFRNLKTMTAWRCNGLAYILACSAARSLVQLRILQITECNFVIVVIANDEVDRTREEIVFSHLKVLKLDRLPNLSCFCDADHGFEFPCLDKVIVSKCPKLKMFSQGVLSAPKLQRVQLTEGKDLDFWNGDLNSTVQQMFTDMVGFRDMEYLKLSQFSHLKEIWHGQGLPVSFFGNLSSLVLDDCTFFLSAIPANLLHLFKKLKILEVRNCDSLEEVFHMEEQIAVEHFGSLFPKLDELKLIDLPKLKRFCNFTSDVIELPSLSYLLIQNCPHMETFISNYSIPINMAANDEHEAMALGKSFLADVQPLFDEKVAFPNLERMTLSNLDSLQNIWHSQFHADSFCKLKVLRVEFCEKIMTIVPYDTLGRSSSIEDLVIADCASVQQVFNLEGLNEVERTAVAPFRLKQLFISRLPKLKYICNKDARGLLTFQNLETLTAIECWSMKSLFPMCMATNLIQLKNLTIRSCGLAEIVAEDEVDGAPVFVFPQLTFLVLQNLPELECFYPRLHTAEWPMLKCLSMVHCHKIKTFSSKLLDIQETDVDSQPKIPIQVPLFLVEKIVPNLERLSLNSNDITSISRGHLPAEIFYRFKNIDLVCFHDESAVFPSGFLERFLNVEHLILFDCNFKRLFTSEVLDEENHDSKLDLLLQNLEILQISNCPSLTRLVPSTASFQNLKTVIVWRCNGLAYVLGCSVARSLVQLRNLQITECNLVTEVIANEEVDRTRENIIFSHLKVLKLDRLPNLSCFCDADHSFEFPCLDKVIVSKCPKLKMFSQGVLSSPKLLRVQLTEGQDLDCWNGDLNSTIHRMFTDMVGFRDMEYLELSQFPHLREIWHSQSLPVSFFSSLSSLVLNDCPFILSAIPANLLHLLKKLKILEVRNCDSLEEVFHMEEQNAVEHFGSLFPKLDELKLIDLPKLKRFCNFTGDVIELPFLSKMCIENCPNLETFISKSIHLTTNDEPHGMVTKENFADDIQPLFDEKVAFPRLKELKLSALPKMLYLWKENSQPSKVCEDLETLKLVECKKLEKLVPSRVSFQNLTTLEVSKCDGLINVVTLSTAESLVKLETMKITDCRMIEEIIQLQVGEEVKDCIVFSQLKYFEFNCLPSLSIFSLGNYTLEFPSLEKVFVSECPKMKIFSQGVSVTPNLNNVQLTEEDDEGCWEGNLNDTIEQLFKQSNTQSSKNED